MVWFRNTACIEGISRKLSDATSKDGRRSRVWFVHRLKSFVYTHHELNAGQILSGFTLVKS